MKEEKLKQELTPTVEKKKLLTGSLLENIVFWVAIIASAILAFYFFFGEKIDPLRIILKEDHECKGVGCGECGAVGLVRPEPVSIHPSNINASKHAEDAEDAW